MLVRITDDARDALLRLVVALQTLFTPVARGPLARQATVGARGLSFFEYAILAAIIIVVGVTFKGLLTTALQSVWGNITETWDKVKS